mmetsp:Transcript_18985/g.33445  ORF Transcript_18985/g.33445 Transcript_18985/m.33445 type:complete len:519 (-) Transcript_18985:525-2081(-)
MAEGKVQTQSTLAEIDGDTTASSETSSDVDEQDSVLRNRKSSSASKTAGTSSAQAQKVSSQNRWAARMKSLMAILCLWSFAPLLMIMATYAWLKHRLVGGAFEKGKSAEKKKLSILVTGGKMSKASAVARAVGRDGHKVFTAEIMPYQFCHTRFTTYASQHYVLPRPTVKPAEWQAKILEIVKEQNIDLIIPCTAPVESSAYAHLRDVLPAHVRVFAFDGKTSDILDHKYTFNQVLANSKIPCPETANMECYEDAAEFFKKRESMPDDGKRFIVKPAVYDPKARTEILFLPIEDKKRQKEYLKSRNATPQVPYVIQEVLTNPEYGSYAIYNQGHLTGFEFFVSAASCLVYKQCKEQFDKVLQLNKDLGKAMNLTGQLTLDLMHKASGELVPIECNPRIHSAVCTLEGHRNTGAMFTDPNHKPEATDEMVFSHPEAFKYWLMDQLFLMLGFWKAKNCFKLTVSEMLQGNDALLHGDDPMPFLAMYLVQIPSLLMLELISGTEWLKIDFCIGKIVKEGGD